jgi:pimeloyl-ACP methyl ester carboxylesterase
VESEGALVKILRWLMLILGVVAVAGGGYMFYEVRRHPLVVAESIGKRALVEAAILPSPREGPVGRVALWVGGAGPPLVLVHGVNGSAASWQHVAPRLADRFEVAVLDLPGHGGSAPGLGPVTLADLLATLSFVVTEVGEGEPVTLVGQGLGARLSMLLAARDAERIARLVAINGGLAEAAHEVGRLTSPRSREEARALTERMRDPSRGRVPDFLLDGMVRRADRDPLSRLRLDAGPRVAAELSSIAIPVDLVWGASDGITPLAAAKGMAEQLVHGQLSTIEACGHRPSEECPEDLIETLDRVLERAPRKAGAGA